MKYLIDGIDRLGKSTLIQNILDKHGYHLVIHYDKPKVLESYKLYNVDGRLVDLSDNAARRIYQEETNKHMFQLMRTKVPIIFDRTHLGEMVYAPLYRGYSGEYVYEEEHKFIFDRPGSSEEVRLILLTTSNFDMLKDDGLSFNWENKAMEQQMFRAAFDKSIIPNKVVVDVHNGEGGYKSYDEIYQEAILARN